MEEIKKVGLCGVPGMKKNDIKKMEEYIKGEYKNVVFTFISEDVLEKEELIEKCKDLEVLISWDQEMDDETYRRLDLRAYCAASIGFNAANIEAASRNKVIVTNVSDYCVDEVAVHTVMMILALNRKLNKMAPYVEDGNWDLEILGSIKRFENSTVGLLGFGSIPRSVARKLSGFGVHIISYDPFVCEEEMKEFNVEKVELDTLLSTSDYLSLHTPLLPSTDKLINMENIKKMKATAYIINTARGALIDQADLLEALENGLLQGAGLDVLENEPPRESDKKIIDSEKTIVTAHSAYVSDEASDLQLKITSKIVGDILKSKIPINVRNPEVLGKVDWAK